MKHRLQEGDRVQTPDGPGVVNKIWNRHLPGRMGDWRSRDRAQISVRLDGKHRYMPIYSAEQIEKL